MRTLRLITAVTLFMAFAIADAAPGDELTQMVQLHLVELGYRVSRGSAPRGRRESGAAPGGKLPGSVPLRERGPRSA